MSELISLNDVRVNYGARAVIRGASLSVEAGSFCALLGPNGSGKTTLLKAVAGLIPLKGGRCRLNGVDTAAFHERQRARLASYIPQRTSKMIGVTVTDAVLMGRNAHLHLLASPSAEDKAAARACLSEIEIEHLAGRDFSTLSEGQKQLVILARALMQNAPVMLMDEPDSALDFVNRNLVLKVVRALIHKNAKAALIALHDPGLALAYCDRLLTMKDGEIAGDISIATAARGEIESALRAIYGPVRLIAHGGRYIMVQEDDRADD